MRNAECGLRIEDERQVSAMKRIWLIAAASLTLLSGGGVGAQERMGSAAPAPAYRPGWTLTPTFGVAETYDDNISFFGRNTAEEQNDDYIATYFPEVDLHYAGHHTQFGSGYTGSFLDYRSHSGLNRWDQRGRIEVRREETAQIKWFAHGNAAAVPTTDLIDLGGIPFRRTGATTMDGRAGVEYVISGTNAVSTSVNYNRVDFERPDDVSAFLRGGHIFESMSAWRHKIDERMALGADYSFRRASIVGDAEPFNLHSTQAAIDYEISPIWSLSGAGGIVYMESTPTIEGRTGPAWRIAVERHRVGRTFHVSYLRSFIPSFGFGGTVKNEQVSVGYRTPLFNNRRFYLDNVAVFRDDQPLTDISEQLPLRSLRTYTIFGWEAQPWVRIEAFYARVDQSSLRAGGRLDRNRIGFQIVTSKPVRMP